MKKDKFTFIKIFRGLCAVGLGMSGIGLLIGFFLIIISLISRDNSIIFSSAIHNLISNIEIFILSLFSWKICTSILSNVIFNIINIKRIRIIGATMITYGAIDLFYFVLKHFDILNSTNNTIRFTQGGELIAGVIVLALAEIFKIGFEIKKENELTV